jgi:hypothetical protein
MEKNTPNINKSQLLIAQIFDFFRGQTKDEKRV